MDIKLLPLILAPLCIGFILLLLRDLTAVEFLKADKGSIKEKTWKTFLGILSALVIVLVAAGIVEITLWIL